MILSGEGRYVPGSQSSTTSVDSDPFTGQGRYIPGGGGVTNGAAGGTDPFTGGGRYVPTYREEPKRKPVGAGDSRAADPITGNYTHYERYPVNQTADPGVTKSIPTRSHTFVKIMK